MGPWLLAILFSAHAALHVAPEPVATTDPDPAPPIVFPVIDPLEEVSRVLEDFAVREGPFAGAVRATPGGGLNWYFANQALILLVESHPEVARGHLDAYLRNLGEYAGALAIVPDYEDSAFTRPRQPDSHDAYAATLLILATRYVEHTRDWAWFETNKETLKEVARHNILHQVKDHGGGANLVRVFQAGSRHLATDAELPGVGYLMDNCEAYAGLRAFGRLLSTRGDAHGSLFLEVAGRIAKGIDRLWLPEVGAYRWADEAPSLPGIAWYPDLMCQVFPDLYEVPVGVDQQERDERARRAWDYLQSALPGWYTLNDDDHPQLIVGYYSAYRNMDPHMAGWSLENWERRPSRPGSPHGFWNVADLGWAFALRQILHPGGR